MAGNCNTGLTFSLYLVIGEFSLKHNLNFDAFLLTNYQYNLPN